MTSIKKLRIILTILLINYLILVMAFLTSCEISNVNIINTKTFSTESKSIELTISVAASLKDVMGEIKLAYEKQNSDIVLTYNFGSSGSLQKQIEQGAFVDVFISAATKYMDELEDKGLIIEDTRKDFLENKLVLIEPIEFSAITDFNGLAKDTVKRIGIGEPKSVPAGQYGEELFNNIGIIDLLRSKFVYAKDVREVLLWVETGNVDAGLVYETDARASEKVRLVARAPEGMYTPVYYPAAVIKESENREEAKDFVEFLYSSEAKPIFEEYGFVFIEQ